MYLYVHLQEVSPAFQRGCTNLHSCQQRVKLLVGPCSLSALGIVSFTNISHFVGCLRYLVVVLICIALLTGKVEYLFTALLSAFIFYFIKCQFQASAHFSIGLSEFLKLLCRSCLHILDLSHLLIMQNANIFSHSVTCLLFSF